MMGKCKDYGGEGVCMGERESQREEREKEKWKEKGKRLLPMLSANIYFSLFLLSSLVVN